MSRRTWNIICAVIGLNCAALSIFTKDWLYFVVGVSGFILAVFDYVIEKRKAATKQKESTT